MSNNPSSQQGSTILLLTHASSDFSGSAEDIRFELEGDGQPILRARLGDVEGNLHDRDINLSERIGNDNGNLNFGMSPPSINLSPKF